MQISMALDADVSQYGVISAYCFLDPTIACVDGSWTVSQSSYQRVSQVGPIHLQLILLRVVFSATQVVARFLYYKR